MARLVEVSEKVRAVVPTVEPVSQQTKRRRAKSAGIESGQRSGDGWRRTAADVLLLNMATRIGAISLRQAHRYIYRTSYKNVQRRVQFMVEAGLINRIDTLPWAGTVLWPSRQGRIVGVGVDSPLVEMDPPSTMTMLHRLLAGEEVLKSALVDGLNVFTEREIRVLQTRGGDDLYNALDAAGVRRSDGTTPGVVPSRVVADLDGRGRREIEAWLMVPMTHSDTDLRSPDFVEVTERGTLRAVEIELAPKRDNLLKAILAGYRDSVRGHGEVMRGQGWTLKQAGGLNRQFESVRWVCSAPVYDILRGPANGIRPISGKPDNGMIRDIWDDSLNSFLFFQDPKTWNLDRKQWPISCTPIDLDHDAGMEYELLQRSLAPTYRCSFGAWKKWRRLWKKDTAGDTDPVAFDMWLRYPGNHRRCLDEAGR